MGGNEAVRRELATSPVGALAVRVAAARPAAACTLARLGAVRSFLVTIGFGLVVVAALTAGFAAITADVADGDDLTTLDAPILDAVAAQRTDAVTSAARIVTTLGSPPAMAILAVVAGSALAWRRRSRGPAVALAATWLGIAAVGSVTKLVMGRARPPLEDAVLGVSAHGFAFPSGHSSISMAVLASLAVLIAARAPLVWRAAALGIAVAAAVAVGLSRIYLDVHWPTDVVASWLLGLAWTAAVFTALAAWRVVDAWRLGPDQAAPAGRAQPTWRSRPSQ